MKKVILTGASGFMGGAVLDELLKQGIRVHCILHEKPIPREQAVSFAQNLFDVEGVKRLLEDIRADTLIHCAWNVKPGEYLSSLLNEKWFEVSKELIDAFYGSGGERFLGIGTCYEYDLSSGFCTEETTALSPKTLYAQCKLKTFEYLKQTATKKNKSYAWARVFYLFGRNESPERFIPFLIQRLRQNLQTGPRYGSLTRDYIYLEDLAGQIAALAKSSYDGAVNTGTGQGYSLQEIAQTVARLMRKEHLILNHRNPPGDEPLKVVADMSRFKKVVGEIHPLPLTEGLKKLL